MANTNIDIYAGKNGHGLTRSFLYAGERPEALEDYDLLVVAGGSQHVWQVAEHPWLADEKSYIADAIKADKAVLGLCLGGQLVAEALGAEVYKAESKEIGWHPITIAREGLEKGIFGRSAQNVTTFHWHSAQFTLPPGSVPLASNSATPVQGFASLTRPVVGLQFHPEYTRNMVRYFATDYGVENWEPETYVHSAEKTLSMTEELSDTYPLMAHILDFMEKAAGGKWPWR